MHPTGKRLAVVAVVLAATTSTTAASGAAPDWRKVPHSATEATLMDIAAISGTDAWTVGTRQPPNDTGYPLAEHWDGTSWKEVPVPATPTGSGELAGVSAVSSDDVWAVGDSTGLGPVLRHWDGTSWAAVAPAAPPAGEHPGADRLYDVAAVSKTRAWAVGLYSNWDNPGVLTLIESWDGQKWSRLATPTPGLYGSTLQGVSAVSATDAWAVGWYLDGDQNVALALHWDGRAWTRSKMKLPAGNTELQGVTAVSANDVWAVGDNEGRPLALHWDGRAWSVLPRPTMTSAWLRSAAPDGKGGMWAAGYQLTDEGVVSRPLFLHWNGKAWTVGTSEEPEGVVNGLARSGASIWAVGTTSPCPCFVAPPLVEISGTQ